ncbi:protocadherin alpha-4-like isoform X7 [Anolis sagrei]|uniref:protocadherin alpha-4-like isoform X7 n=1 Tax=Anolis sagrei TaxID=38937 RepID=UPI0035220E79
MVAWQNDSVLKQLLHLILLHTAWEMGSGQLHYSVSEESQHGTFVGRIAQDLGLEVSELVPRMFRMISKGQKDFFEVNVQNGILFVNSRIDREELCADNADCSIHLEVIVDKPLRVFHVEVEIRDINDNAPVFSANEKILSIAEVITATGTRFQLEGASDADIGPNALLTYKLRPNDYFSVEQKTEDHHNKPLAIVLKKPLDREEIPTHHLLVTATDGGKPELTGTVQLVINVLDTNDNPPVFNQSVYRIKLVENAANGTLVIKLNATDLDERTNGEISYFCSAHIVPNFRNIFNINSNTGEVTVSGRVDFEERSVYDLQIVAEDKGNPPLTGHCRLIIEVLDMNDNAPEVSISSLSVPVPEDSPPGTVVGLISISDKDSDANGLVTCSLWPPGLPFKLVSTFKNYYSLVVAEPLDREHMAEYGLMVMAQDRGVPSLSASTSVVVPIRDINDNAPAFTQPSYTVFVKENNPPGAHIFTVSAFDPDIAENSLISYWIDEKLWPLSSYISVHSESGKLYALQPLDYEELKLLEFQVNAKDAGLPSLCGNVTIQVFVVDENDNAPAVTEQTEDNSILLVVPVAAGHMLGKIHALDADSGYNAWLRYELHEGNSGPWRVGLYSGELSTIRSVDEAEGSRSHNLRVLVKDHGKPQLSATATLSVSLVTSAQAIQTNIRLPRTDESSKPKADLVNLYLIIAICSVSSLFLLAVITYVALRCQFQPKEPMVYGPGTATLVCASEVGSWSYSNRHSHILAGVNGEALAKNDLMVFSPNIPASSENGNQQDLLCGTPKPPNPDWRYSASLRAGMQGAVHMDEAGALRVGPGPEQQWPTVSSATTEPEAGEVSPPVGAGVNSNSWTFKYGPGNSKQPGPGELPDKFIIPGSPAIISIRQDPPNSQTDKSDFITFGKKEETKKKKKKKKGNKAQEKKEKGNSTTDNSDQ